MHGNFSCFLGSLKFYRMYGSFLKNRCKIASNIMKWYCNFIVKLPYVRKFLHIFWVGNLVNINFWPLTLTVFINFDGCWIMVVKNTPFFRSFSFLKFPENLKNWRISVFFFSSSFKIFRKNRGDWPSTFWSYPPAVLKSACEFHVEVVKPCAYFCSFCICVL